MSSDNNQKRYDDILKRIANRKPFGPQVEQQPKSAYDLILDSLNAYDTFAALTIKSYEHILCYGPQIIRKPNWSGVIIWYLSKGYSGYRELHLLGIWAHQLDTDIVLTVGLRTLPYQAAIYNAEGFHASIRKSFKLFYEDDGYPPTQADTILFQSVYEAKERLTLRQTLQRLIDQWEQDDDFD